MTVSVVKAVIDPGILLLAGKYLLSRWLIAMSRRWRIYHAVL